MKTSKWFQNIFYHILINKFFLNCTPVEEEVMAEQSNALIFLIYELSLKGREFESQSPPQRKLGNKTPANRKKIVEEKPRQQPLSALNESI